MECPQIPIISYRDFSSPLHDQAAQKNIPIVGELDLTRRCNLQCKHCYCYQDHNKKELTTDEVYRILDEITDAGCLWLLFTGGEPLIRPDFLDIYTYAKKKGLVITLFTNGTLVTPEIADYLREWPPFSVEISIYGAIQKTHESVTGVPGSYKRCLDGIEMLIQRDIPLKLKTMIITLNQHELWMMKKFSQEHNLDFRFDTLVHPRLDGTKQPCQFRVSLHDAVEFDFSDSVRHDRWRRIYSQYLKKNRVITDFLYPCGFGIFSFHITAYGELQICLIANEPSFSLRENSFSKCWLELIKEIQLIKSKETNECKYCKLFPLCAPCPAWAKLENGDPNSVVEYTCQIGHLLLEALEKEEIATKGDGKDAEENKKALQETIRI
jgi:radical SAM protein with 4Fe4S-binding SPASM domain